MEIVSSCNHRYTPILCRRALSALIDSSVPRGKVRGTSVPAVRSDLQDTRLFSPPSPRNLIPVARPAPPYICETVFLADVTVRFSDAARRCNKSQSEEKSGPPTTIHRCTSRSLRELVRSAIAKCRFTPLPHLRERRSKPREIPTYISVGMPSWCDHYTSKRSTFSRLATFGI